MSDFLTLLPTLSGLIEKGGVIGLLVVVCCVLAWEIKRLRAAAETQRVELIAIYRERDKWRLAFTTCRTACEHAGVKLNLNHLLDIPDGGV